MDREKTEIMQFIQNPQLESGRFEISVHVNMATRHVLSAAIKCLMQSIDLSISWVIVHKDLLSCFLLKTFQKYLKKL